MYIYIYLYMCVCIYIYMYVHVCVAYTPICRLTILLDGSGCCISSYLPTRAGLSLHIVTSRSNLIRRHKHITRSCNR